MNCKFCGTENPDDAKFCLSCGKRIDGKVVCSACGAEVPQGVYCVHCGARLDGKTQCSCGTVYEGNFCPACGKPAANSPTNAAGSGASAAGAVPYNGANPYRIKPGASSADAGTKPASAAAKKPLFTLSDKVRRYVTLGMEGTLLLGAVVALILVFFAGFSTSGLLSDLPFEGQSSSAKAYPLDFRQKFSLLYFFGGTYKDVAAHLRALNGYSALYCAILYIGAGTGTAIAAFTILSVAIGTILAIVNFIMLAIGKSEKSSARHSLFALFAFLGGMLALTFAYGMKMKIDFASDIQADVSYRLNGAAIAGIIVAAVVLSLYFLTKAIFNYKNVFVKRPIFKTVCAFIAAGLAIAIVCILAAPLGGIFYSVNLRGYESQKILFSYRASILTLLQDAVFSNGDPLASEGPYVISLIVLILGTAFVFLAVFALKTALCRLVEPEKRHTSVHILNTVISLTVMILSIIAINKAGDVLLKDVHEAFGGYALPDQDKIYGGYIAEFILCLIFTVCSILAHFRMPGTEPLPGQNPYAKLSTPAAVPQSGTNPYGAQNTTAQNAAMQNAAAQNAAAPYAAQNPAGQTPGANPYAKQPDPKAAPQTAAPATTSDPLQEKATEAPDSASANK